MAGELPVMLLVDNSASMAGAPLEAVNRGLILCAQMLMSSPSPHSTRLGLIRFATDAELLQRYIDPHHFHPPRLMAGGTTALSKGLITLGHSLREDSRAPLVFLLTDGRPDVGDPWREVLASIYSSGFSPTFVGLGIGPDIDEGVLAQLAGSRVFRLHRPDPRGITEAFTWIGQTVTQWQGEPGRIGLQEPPGWSRTPPHTCMPRVVEGELLDSLSTYKSRHIEAVDVEEAKEEGHAHPSPSHLTPGDVVGNTLAPLAAAWNRPLTLNLTDRYILTVVTSRGAWSKKLGETKLRWHYTQTSKVAAIHPSGDVIASSLGGKVRLATRGHPGSTLPMERCTSVSFSSSGQWLAMAGRPALHIVEVNSARTALCQEEKLIPSSHVHLCTDGIHLALVDESGLLRMWNLETGQVVWYMELSTPLHLSNGGKNVLLISTVQESMAVDNATGEVYWWHPFRSSSPPHLTSLAMHQLVARPRSESVVEVLSIRDGEACATIPATEGDDLVTNSRGQLLLVGKSGFHLGEFNRRGHTWKWVSLLQGQLNTAITLLVILCLTLSSTSPAQSATAPIQQLPQTPAPGGLLFTQGSTLPLPLQSWITLSYAHANAPWLWFVREGDDPGSWEPLITQLDHISVGLTVGLSPHFAFGLVLPAQWTSIDSEIAEEIGTPLQQGGPIPGDPGLELRWVPIHLRRLDVSTGLVANLTLPLGEESYQAGAGVPTSSLTWLVDQRRDRHQLALNVGWTHTYADLVTVGGAVWGDELHLAVGGRWDLLPEKLGFMGDVSASSIVFPWGYIGSPLQSPLEITAGVYISPDGRWSLSAGGGAGITLGYGTPNWRLFSGLTCRLGSTQDIRPTLPLSTRMKLRYVEHPRVDVDASHDLNGGRPLRLLLVETDGSTFRRLRYDDISHGIYPPGMRVLEDLEIRPGASVKLSLAHQPLQQLALLGMFTDETPRWKVLLGGSPLPFTMAVHLDYDGISVEE